MSESLIIDRSIHSREFGNSERFLDSEFSDSRAQSREKLFYESKDVMSNAKIESCS